MPTSTSFYLSVESSTTARQHVLHVWWREQPNTPTARTVAHPLDGTTYPSLGAALNAAHAAGLRTTNEEWDAERALPYHANRVRAEAARRAEFQQLAVAALDRGDHAEAIRLLSLRGHEQDA